MNAAELFVKCLEQENVQYVFGLPGEENAHFMMTLEDAAAAGKEQYLRQNSLKRCRLMKIFIIKRLLALLLYWPRLHHFTEVIESVNRSSFGLQTGVFTRDIHKTQYAWNELEVGGVIIGDVPSWRADQMPYGGVKDSGLGREGIRYAIEDMTELRLLVIRNMAL